MKKESKKGFKDVHEKLGRFSKLAVLLLLVAMVMTMTACGSGDNATATPNPPSNTNEATPNSPGNEAAPVKKELEGSLTISAAASLQEAVEELSALYTSENSKVKFELNFGPSGQLQQQIEQGAPADVFISAAEKQMNTLDTAGLLLDGTRLDLLQNDLIMIARDGITKIDAIEKLTNADIKYIAIGNPESVPAGQYAQETLESIGIWADVQGKLVMAQNVRQVISFVEAGNADYGFVYASDMLVAETSSEVLVVPDNLYSPVIYPTAVIKATKQADLAKDFVDFLQTDAAKAIFEEKGFKVL